MIKSFKHRGLRRLFEKADPGRIDPRQICKIELILADLDAADSIAHMRRPGYRLHKLQGDLSGHHAITISGNWRIVFRITAENVWDIDLVDYH